jgi:hypothetical protein
VRRGERLPDDAAEVVLSDVLVEQLVALDAAAREDVLVELARLCEAPGGRHPLRAPLAGWNTVDVLGAQQRIVYRAQVIDGFGLIEALCLGPRTHEEVYDTAVALRDSGLLTDTELADLWETLAILDVVAEVVGLDGWDFRPSPAPEGMRRAAVAAGLIDARTAALLSRDEIEAAMDAGWGPEGPRPSAALVAALERARGRSVPLDAEEAAAILATRAEDRCGALLPRVQRHCVRRAGHPGPHRSR